MRILLVSDIHANWPALQALEESCDVCVCLGDLVDYGLEPGPCIDWVRQRARYVVRGNHDHGAAQDVRVSGQHGFKYLTMVTRPITRQRLGPADLRYLGQLPVSRTVTLHNVTYLFVHATPRDPLDEYAPTAKEFWSRCLDGVDADVICVGHTHQPFVFEIDGKVVINPGSIGLPRDGDPRASYAIIDGDAIALKRYEYPVEAAVRVVEVSPLPASAKEQLIHVYRTGEGAKGLNNVHKSGSVS